MIYFSLKLSWNICFFLLFLIIFVFEFKCKTWKINENDNKEIKYLVKKLSFFLFLILNIMRHFFSFSAKIVDPNTIKPTKQ